MVKRRSRVRWEEVWPVEVVVARIAARVETERISLRAAMEDFFAQHPELGPIRGLVRAFSLAMLRYALQIDWLVRTLVGEDPRRLPPFERNLLRALVYEYRYRSVPLDRVVKLARRIRGLRLERRDFELLASADLAELVSGMGWAEKVAVVYSVPKWVAEYLGSLLGREQAEVMLDRMNRPATLWVRVNTLLTTRERLIEALRRRGFDLEPDKDLPDVARVLRLAGNLSHTPEHSAGHFYLQDKASALVGHLLGPALVVYDMCAAPGGKATHAYQVSGGCALVVAAEWKFRRLASMRAVARRLHAHIEPVLTDSRMPPLRGVDAVILDPDCSSLGRLGHSPEIRLWTAPVLVKRFAETQRELLRASASLLKRGGRLVYSTCTVTLEENEENIKWACDELGFEPVHAEPRVGFPGLGVKEAQRLYPHVHDTQGFFACVLVKV